MITDTETLYRNVGPLSVPFASRYQLKKIAVNPETHYLGDDHATSTVNTALERFLIRKFSCFSSDESFYMIIMIDIERDLIVYTGVNTYELVPVHIS